jgi:hypothetical protein
MQFQTTLDNATAEKVFRLARNAKTATTTVTAATIARGAPVCLATDSVSNNGIFAIAPDTAGANLLNNLFIGCVYDFPDTSSAHTGTWQAEAVGLVQCYGLMTNAILLQNATASLAAGLCLSPNTGTTLITVAGPATAAATSTAGHVELTGIGGLAILAGTVATNATTTATVAVSVHLRCM